MKNPISTISKTFLFAAALSATAISADAATPTDVYSDPLINIQWQWEPSRGGINIADAWNAGITGKGIVIGINDDWVEPFHEDLNVSTYNPTTNWRTANFSQGLSYDFVNPGFSPSPSDPQPYEEDRHGTACAGMAAAIGGNNLGIVGAAPGATIAGLNGSGSYEARFWASGVSESGVYQGEALIDIKSNSYGGNFSNPNGNIDGVALTAANNIIYLFSAGNARAESDHQYGNPTNTGFRNNNNDRRIITVAASNNTNQYASFSNYGSNVFVTAPGIDVPSTGRTGSGYLNQNYTYFNGTSAATPLVSGVMALGKQVFKDMDVRWAKHAIAWSSGHNENPNIDPDSKSLATAYKLPWEPEATGFWQKNNGGYWFNNNYGFGKIDAVGFVDATKNILYTTTEKTFVVPEANFTGGDITSSELVRKTSYKFTPENAALSQNLETVAVRVNFSNAARTNLNLSTLKITLIAPDGASSVVVSPSVGDPETKNVVGYYTFLTNAFWGANYGNSGEWTVEIQYNADAAGTNTTGWVTMNQVEFSTGNVVFEDTTIQDIAAGTSIDAHAIALDNSTSNFTVAGTMNLEDSVFVNGGTLNLAATGTLAPYTAGQFGADKGLKFQQTGGTVNFAGTANFKRGFKQTGGTFNFSGTLNSEKGIYVSGTGSFVIAAATSLANNLFVSGADASLIINDGGNLDYSAGTLTVDDGATLTFNSDNVSSSTITINSNALIVITNKAKFKLNIAQNVADFQNFDFVAVSASYLATVQLANENISIVGNDGNYTGNFDLIKDNGKLIVSLIGNMELISEEAQDYEVSSNGARFRSTLKNYAGTLTGTGILESNFDISFAANASGFSGETKISNSNFTIKSGAQLGTGTFTVGANANLIFDGNQTFNNTVSGDGSMKVIAGTLNFGGNASALAGTATVDGNSAKIIAGTGSTLNNLALKNNASAELAGTINGDLSIAGASATLKTGATVAGKFILNNATLTTESELTLNNNAENLFGNNSKIIGNVTVANANLTINESTIEGNLKIDNIAGTVKLNGAKIIGDFTATAGTVNLVGSNNVSGEISISSGVTLNQDTNATLTAETMTINHANYDLAGSANIENLVIQNGSTFTQGADGAIRSLQLLNNSTATLAGIVAGAVSVDATSMLTATANAFTNTAVTNNGKLYLKAGTLTQRISGTGTTTITEDITTTANNVGSKFTTNENVAITLTAGTLENQITGAGTIIIAGNVDGNADNFDNKITINNAATLTLNAGTLGKVISGAGTTIIAGEVTTNADNLGTQTIVNQDKKITLSAGTLNRQISGDGTIAITGDVTTSANNLNANVENNGALTLTTGTLNKPIAGTGTIALAGDIKTDASNLGASLQNNQRLVLTGGALMNSITGTGTTEIIGNIAVFGNNPFGNNRIVVNGGRMNLNNGITINNTVKLLLSDEYRIIADSAAPEAAFGGNGNFTGTLLISAINNRYVSQFDDLTLLSFALAEANSTLATSLAQANILIDETLWADWSIINLTNGTLTLAYRYDTTPYSAPSGLNELYKLVGDKRILGYVKSTFDARLVALSPIGYASLLEMQNGCANLVNDLLRERLEQRRYETANAWDNSMSCKFYANAFGQSRDSSGNGTKSANYDINHKGVVAGVDVPLSNRALFGFGVAADIANAQVKNGEKNQADTTMLTFSGMQMFNNTYIGLGLSAGTSWLEAKRTLDNENFSKKTNGLNANLSVIAGAGWILNEQAGIDFSPFVGIDIGYTYVKGFSENTPADSAQSAALKVDSFDHFSMRGKIGASLNWRASKNWRLGIEATFAHEFVKPELDIDAAFKQNAAIGDQKFTSTAYLMEENSFQIGPRLDYTLNRNWSLSLAYTYESDFKDVTSHSGNVGARCRF